MERLVTMTAKLMGVEPTDDQWDAMIDAATNAGVQLLLAAKDGLRDDLGDENLAELASGMAVCNMLGHYIELMADEYEGDRDRLLEAAAMEIREIFALALEAKASFSTETGRA